MSYPALYTHTKLKHSEGNEGKPVLPAFNGRGRGWPWKNTTSKADPTTDEFFCHPERTGTSNPLLDFELIVGNHYDLWEEEVKLTNLYKYL